jgi:hypothetical protein
MSSWMALRLVCVWCCNGIGSFCLCFFFLPLMLYMSMDQIASYDNFETSEYHHFEQGSTCVGRCINIMVGQLRWFNDPTRILCEQ